MSPFMIPVAFFIMVLGIVVGYPLAKAYARKIEQRTPTPLPSGDLLTRMERMEQGIEAIATEVERIAEGQRFTTKLLTGPEGSRSNAVSSGTPSPRE